MKYLVRQRFSYTSTDGTKILCNPGMVLEGSQVNAWPNGASMIRAAYIVPHDEANEAPSAEPAVARAKSRKAKKKAAEI